MTNQVDTDLQKTENPLEEMQEIKRANEEAKRVQNTFLKEFGRNPEFKQLVKERQRFLFTTTFIFLALYISLPILTSFTTLLNVKVYGEITLVWIYALSLFVMTIVLCSFYIRQATKHDVKMEALVKKYYNNTGGH